MQKPDQFHSILAARRKALGLTQEQLAKRLNVSAQAVSKWEKSSYPDAELLPRLASALNLSLDALFGMRGRNAEQEPEETVSQAVKSLPPEKRPELIARIFYAALCAYNPSSDGETGKLRSSYEHETFALLHTDHEIALERLNPELRYFLYMEKPEHGIADYLRDEQGVVRLLSTLADTDALRIVKYMACSCRNKLFVPDKLSEKLGIPLERVQKVINRLDRFGFVWRMAADLGGDAPTIVYGYTHDPALAAILVLAQTVCRYIKFCDPKVDLFTYGTMQDRTTGDPESIPEVSAWDTDNL
ncbi:MAG: helix-turn-helix transcriptional regulator [Oscillospiraceae bacterium]|nr:helix-turn-helix transcriptional regulator [Oscillospiraceae bacterium]